MDLKGQITPIRKEIDAAINEVLEDVGFANGPAVRRFERNFASYCGVNECVAVGSGTSALHVAMSCLDVGPGSEVITVSMSFIATAWPVLYLGARAVFVDIDPRRYTMDPEGLEVAITSRTKAIVPVHLYGQCADMDAILSIADRHGIPVIEDCAHAPGAEYKGRRAGSMGVLGCFSFYPTKNLGACGEGGVITTNDGALAERARMIRDHGQRERYIHECVGYNYRMDGFQGAILDVKLRYLDAWNESRRSIAEEYGRQLSSCRIVTPWDAGDGKNVYHLYVIQDDNRQALRDRLEKGGIGTGLHYPFPIHLQPPFESMGFTRGDLPATDELARKCVSLPIYPHLTESQIARVASAIAAARRTTL
jgi:dTDP-4-amino-4,6-dideoxygalactose transaminase